LATHAVADGDDPTRSFVAFAPEGPGDTIGRLYEPAICQLDMSHAELVILSACQTADGPLVRSEGVISLSRAFSYAGCRSVVTSLWKADDAATAYIVRRFHYHLRAGLAKDLALRQAKLDYLGDKVIGMRRQLPEYWAHLILVGDPGAVVITGGGPTGPYG
jgi:CHAT domain-containing protein